MTMDVERIILDKLTALERKVDVLTEKVIRLEERSSRKAGLYGLMGGLIPAMVVLVYWMVTHWGI